MRLLSIAAKKPLRKQLKKSAAENAAVVVEPPSIETEDNMSKTYREFMERFLPIYARKRNFSPKTYDSYRQNLETHIYPYFGDWVMSSITSSAYVGFIDYLFQNHVVEAKVMANVLQRFQL